jgi:hypothetical protein
LAWKLLHFPNEKEVLSSSENLITVHSTDLKGDFVILGTGFPIVSSSTSILAITALHVIEEGYKKSLQASRTAKRGVMGFPGPSNLLYEQIGGWVRNTNDLKCSITIGKSIYVFNITGVCLRPPLDIAFMIIDASSIGEPIPVFAINSNPLTIGENVVVTSFVTSGNKRTLIGKVGEITAKSSTSRLVRAPHYATNIPIEKGASGGPVFRFQENFSGDKQVIGMISSDFSQ